MELFKILGKIAVENADANKSLDETAGKAEGFGTKLKNGIGTVAKWGTAIVGASATAVVGLTNFAKSSAETADNIDKMSQKIGVSREAYQELDFICSQSGMSVDSLQTGMKTLTAAMDGAASGTEKNVEQFERLGIAVTNSDGSFRSQEDVLFDTLASLQGIEDQTEKARLATELFGKSGTELMPLLNGASGSIDEMKQQAHDLGLILDDELIDNGVNLNDSIDQTQRAFESVATQLGGALMPIVLEVSEYIQGAMPLIQSMTEQLAPVITALFEALLPPLMELLEQLLPVVFELLQQLIPPLEQILSAILPVIVQLLQTLLPPILQVVEAILPILVALIQALLPILSPIIELLTPILDILMLLLSPLLTLIELILPPITALISLLANTISSVLQPILEGLEGFISDFVGYLKSAIPELLQNLMDKGTEWFSSLSTKLKDNAQKIKDGISNWFSNVRDKVTSFFTNFKTSITNGMTNAYDTVTNKLNSIKEKFSSIFSDAKDTVQGAIDKIKGFFNFNWSLPSLPMPHPYISGSFSLNPPSVPSFGIDWYAKAMDDPMIMNSPTAFGINQLGEIMAGGEAGSEVVSGTDTLMSMISEAVASKNKEMIEVLKGIYSVLSNKYPDGMTINVYGTEGQDVKELAEIIEQRIAANTRRASAAW